MTTFADLGLSQKVLSAVTDAGYTIPTPIQAGAIPHALQRRDICGIAQTGTGKTAAFTLPVLTLLAAAQGKVDHATNSHAEEPAIGPPPCRQQGGECRQDRRKHHAHPEGDKGFGVPTVLKAELAMLLVKRVHIHAAFANKILHPVPVRAPQLHPADSGELALAMMQEGVDQGAGLAAGGRVGGHAGGLVDDDQVGVLVKDGQGDSLGLGRGGDDRRQDDGVEAGLSLGRAQRLGGADQGLIETGQRGGDGDDDEGRAERRVRETLDGGKPVTPFMKFGDRIRIEMFDSNGRTIFGAIDQKVVRYTPPA